MTCFYNFYGGLNKPAPRPLIPFIQLHLSGLDCPKGSRENSMRIDSVGIPGFHLGYNLLRTVRSSHYLLKNSDILLCRLKIIRPVDRPRPLMSRNDDFRVQGLNLFNGFDPLHSLLTRVCLPKVLVYITIHCIACDYQLETWNMQNRRVERIGMSDLDDVSKVSVYIERVRLHWIGDGNRRRNLIAWKEIEPHASPPFGLKLLLHVRNSSGGSNGSDIWPMLFQNGDSKEMVSVPMRNVDVLERLIPNGFFDPTDEVLCLGY